MFLLHLIRSFSDISNSANYNAALIGIFDIRSSTDFILNYTGQIKHSVRPNLRGKG